MKTIFFVCWKVNPGLQTCKDKYSTTELQYPLSTKHSQMYNNEIGYGSSQEAMHINDGGGGV
jgi:hypothetical protein